MSRTSRQNHKYDISNEVLRDGTSDGTAARTRPFSFEEIMLRRKNNKLNAESKGGAGDPGKISGKDNGENVPNRSKSDKGYEEVKKHASEDTVKGSSTKKQESAIPKEDNLVKGSSKKQDSATEKEGNLVKDKGKGKGKEICDAEPNLKQKLDKDMNSRAKGDNEKRSHRRSRNEERSKDDTEADKKRSGNSAGKEKHLDNETRKSERESKRKHRSRDDEKNRLETEGNTVKKRDSGRWYDSELAERKSRKKDSSQSHYEEVRPKRRRSRSRETKDKGRRSISVSPRPQRRTSYHGREHGESSLHSFKDRKQYSDVDRSKLSSNGGYANAQYQRFGGRGSRLGGYSPRKRRTELAVKTPSPTIRSPERKSAGWDLPPTGADISSAASLLSNFQSSNQIVSSNVQELPSAVPATINAVRPQSAAPSSTPSTSKSVSVDSIQLTQATLPMRRLYVENVPTSASDKSIVDGLNNFFLSSGAYHIQGSPPCISCIINKEKSQALVEFLTPEDATTALSFDGRSFLGFILKVRRPKDFIESSTGALEKPMVAVDTIPDLIKDSPYKIFIGGISKILSSDMMMEIASAFGTLRAYRFNANEDINESCAFLEYVDHSVTLKACAGLNGMKLGGQALTVVQATPNATVEDISEMPPFYGIPEHAKPLLSKPTTVLKLKNVLNQEELSTLSGQELEEVLEDTRLECARFGTVKSINIVKYGNTSATVPEAFEVTDQADVRTASQDTADENYTKNTKSMACSGENSRQEVEQDAREPLVDDGNLENNRPSHDEHEEDHVKPSENSSVAPDVPTCHMDTDTNPQESYNHNDTSKDQSTCHDDNTAHSLPHSGSSEGNNLVTKEDLKPEEANGELQESFIEKTDIVKKDSDASDKNENNPQGSNLDDVFEHGCIFVEYARTEASCIAAHCLHGRLFGDRVVVVGYVDHDLYITRFPK